MNIGEMQRKLSQRAAREPDHRFGDLYSLLYNRQWLLAAWHHVRQNAGSRTAGSDGVDRKRFEEEFETHFETLRAALKAGTFEPVPVRRVTIPKAHGVRRLGIPGLHDRIVQEALRMILEPIWEADFHQHSYGFRPTRRTMDAIAYLGCRLTGTGGKTYQWVTEGDIAACFDSIPPEAYEGGGEANSRQEDPPSRVEILARRSHGAEYLSAHAYWAATRGNSHAPNNVAKRSVEFFVRLSREHLRPTYGQGFRGAPLQTDTEEARSQTIRAGGSRAKVTQIASEVSQSEENV